MLNEIIPIVDSLVASVLFIVCITFGRTVTVRKKVNVRIVMFLKLPLSNGRDGVISICIADHGLPDGLGRTKILISLPNLHFSEVCYQSNLQTTVSDVYKIVPGADPHNLYYFLDEYVYPHWFLFVLSMSKSFLHSEHNFFSPVIGTQRY